MNKLISFTYQDNTVRTLTIEGEPWFVAKDVCELLGIKNTSDTLGKIPTAHKGIEKIDTLGGTQEMTTLDEPGLYQVIMRSNKPQAQPFIEWVTGEVIPAIRKHGAYMTPQKLEEVLLNPDTLIKLAENLKAEREKNQALTAKISEDAPKVLFAGAVTASKTSILIGQLAKVMRGNGIEIGQNRLFAWMRENGYLCKTKGERWNTPTQNAMEAGLFEVKESTRQGAGGEIHTSFTTKVTGKGQQFFINKFLTRALVDAAGIQEVAA